MADPRECQHGEWRTYYANQNAFQCAGCGKRPDDIIAALWAEKGAAGSPSVDKEKLEAIRSAANTVLAAFGPVKPSGKLGETLIRLEEAVRD